MMMINGNKMWKRREEQEKRERTEKKREREQEGEEDAPTCFFSTTAKLIKQLTSVVEDCKIG